MPDEPDVFDNEVPSDRSTDRRGDDFNDALKQGFRRAGMHWVRAGYELLAGVGALLEELNQRSPEDGDDVVAERIELD